MISTLARRLVMPSRGQRRRACRLRPELREDLLQGDDAWTAMVRDSSRIEASVCTSFSSRCMARMWGR
jgi:hypothetical protein